MIVRPLVPVVLLVGAALAGCLTGVEDPLSGASGDLAPAFDTSRGWSVPLAPELYAMLDPVKEMVPSFDGTPVALGLFLPDIDGCDWSAAELPVECRIPVVMDAGPYYSDHVDRDKFRPPVVEWLVPRGYAVVQMSVRGTGESAGCMEFFSLAEQKDVDHVVTWLAERPWSNGNVGMMGRSYDGTTPLMAAGLGNPHLKTIVPISGVTSIRDLMFRNGTSELRGPIMHSVVYWGLFGVAEGPHRAEHWSEQACEEFVVGSAEGVRGTATGEAAHEYWEVRDFKRAILENFRGSVWVVHGLHDWNVNPSQVVPWINDLQDAGIETKAWLGVWEHHYPDRVDEHRNVRWDWAEQTLRWFDWYLKCAPEDATTPEGRVCESPRLDIEVEDSLFVWRSEASYPPRDAWSEEVEVAWGNAAVAARMPSQFRTEPFAEDLRIAGLPQLHVSATPTTATGGYLFAELYDVWPDGRQMRIGWGAIDLRHHAGGNTKASPLVPGMPVVALLEFEPTDALVAKGHSLRLVVHKDGVEDILPSPDPSPVLLGKTVLRLPVVDRPNVLPTYTPPSLG